MRTRVRQGLCALRRSLSKGLAKTQAPASLVIALAASATIVASPPAQHGGAAGTQHHRWFQIGKATFYGRAFQGRRTATGERFDMNALTCAHPTLPLGSWLRITNLRNRRFTFVRVNDRGPYTPGAIVDLSFAAAQRVGLAGNGRVRVERVSPDDPELVHALVADLVAPSLLPSPQN